MERSCNKCLRGPEPQVKVSAPCNYCGDDLVHFIPISQYDDWNDSEERIDVIAQNGNDGLHYPNPIVESVREKLRMRSEAGMLKYGTTLAREDLSRLDWLNHLQQELLDAANYLEVLIQREEQHDTKTA
jgi:hypothetical protein